jgi:hypothetical protein
VSHFKSDVTKEKERLEIVDMIDGLIEKCWKYNSVVEQKVEPEKGIYIYKTEHTKPIKDVIKIQKKYEEMKRKLASEIYTYFGC